MQWIYQGQLQWKKKQLNNGEKKKEDRRQEEERRCDVWRQKRQCISDSKHQKHMYCCAINTINIEWK